MHRERLSFNVRGGNNDCSKRSATVSQVGYMRPEFKGGLTQAAVHLLHEKQGARPKQRNSRRKEVDQTIKNAQPDMFKGIGTFARWMLSCSVEGRLQTCPASPSSDSSEPEASLQRRVEETGRTWSN